MVTGSLCEIHRISYICSILRTLSVRCLRNSNGILIEYSGETHAWKFNYCSVYTLSVSMVISFKVNSNSTDSQVVSSTTVPFPIFSQCRILKRVGGMQTKRGRWTLIKQSKLHIICIAESNLWNNVYAANWKAGTEGVE